MSNRTIRDYIAAAFLARDKQTVDGIIKDAEKAVVVDPDDPDKPLNLSKGDATDPDDKDDGDTHVHLHLSKNGDASTGDAVIDNRFKSVEDSIKALDTKMTSFFDALPPEFLQKKNDDTTGDADVSELPGQEGAQTAQLLAAAEPDLMEADPALRTGPSKMGDAAYVRAVSGGMAKLIKDTRARAEALAPGFQFATFDAVPKPGTAKSLCDLRRAAMTKATTTDAGRRLLGRYTADAIKALPCDAVRLAFLDATDRARDANNGQGRNYQPAATMDARAFRLTQTEKLKGINERNRAHWDKQLGRPN